MTVYLTNRDGSGKTNEEGHYKLLGSILSGNVQASTSLQVIQNSPLGMSVLVKSGIFKIDTANYPYIGWIDADTSVTITTADTSNPRITTIVIYVDKSAATSPTPPNNPGVAKLMAINGTASSSPIAPNDTVIQTAVGASNPYLKLAEVLVGANVTQINNANITDYRTQIKLNDSVLSPANMLQAVGPLLYPVGSIYTNASVNTNPATLLGFGTWSQFGQGRVLVGIDTGDTDFGTSGNVGGTKAETLSSAQMPNHTHGIDPPAVNTSSAGSHRHDIGRIGSWGSWGLRDSAYASSSGIGYTSYAGDHTHSVNIPAFTSGSAGNGQSHNNLQPYVVVYMWRRTA